MLAVAAFVMLGGLLTFRMTEPRHAAYNGQWGEAPE
jgi:hypothetical protein